MKFSKVYEILDTKSKNRTLWFLPAEFLFKQHTLLISDYVILSNNNIKLHKFKHNLQNLPVISIIIDVENETQFHLLLEKYIYNF